MKWRINVRTGGWLACSEASVHVGRFASYLELRNLANIEREAGDVVNAKHCEKSKTCNQDKRSKTIHFL